jgi:hypothetical protein
MGVRICQTECVDNRRLRAGERREEVNHSSNEVCRSSNYEASCDKCLVNSCRLVNSTKDECRERMNPSSLCREVQHAKTKIHACHCSKLEITYISLVEGTMQFVMPGQSCCDVESPACLWGWPRFPRKRPLGERPTSYQFNPIKPYNQQWWVMRWVPLALVINFGLIA